MTKQPKTYRLLGDTSSVAQNFLSLGLTLSTHNLKTTTRDDFKDVVGLVNGRLGRLVRLELDEPVALALASVLLAHS